MHGCTLTTALSALLTLLPNPTPISESVHLVEINHVYDPVYTENPIQPPQPRLRQIIWWNWNTTDAEFRVHDWRINSQATPTYSHRDRRWKSRFYDHLDQCPRAVYAISCIETWTNYDPEIQDRDILPVSQRAKLQKPRNMP